MVEGKVIIEDEAGIHARPASLLVKYFKEFPDSQITLINGDKKATGNIIQLLGLGVVEGTELTVQVSGGTDEQAVLDKVCEFIKNLR